jgi:protein-S-isoprenylcysteine O-methyltransferase Ste14
MTDSTSLHATRQPIGQRRRILALFFAAILVALALPFVSPVASEGALPHEAIEVFGMLLIIAAIVGRSWCALYIGGRKAREIVATGPYSISRNPLYAFSLMGIVGIGLQTGSLVMGLFLLAIALAIFLPVIRREEQLLADRFGYEYAAYCARVPRFGPNLAGWRDMETIAVHPERVRQTCVEALVFLLAIPVCEGIDMLQGAGYLVPFIHLF